VIEKILFVSDGIIAIMGNGYVPAEPMNNVVFDLTEYGVELRVSGVSNPFPAPTKKDLSERLSPFLLVLCFCFRF